MRPYIGQPICFQMVVLDCIQFLCHWNVKEADIVVDSFVGSDWTTSAFVHKRHKNKHFRDHREVAHC